MAQKGVNVPFGIPAKSVAEAVAAAKEIGDEEVVIKSQILAGGRGLGTFTNGFKGGVHVIKSSQVARASSPAPPSLRHLRLHRRRRPAAAPPPPPPRPHPSAGRGVRQQDARPDARHQAVGPGGQAS